MATNIYRKGVDIIASGVLDSFLGGSMQPWYNYDGHISLLKMLYPDKPVDNDLNERFVDLRDQYYSRRNV